MKRTRQVFLWVSAAGAALFVGNAVVVRVMHQLATDRELVFGGDPVGEVLEANRTADNRALTPLDEVVPFEEIHPFDAEAHTWTQPFSSYPGTGVTVFDANGDGRMDVYFTRDGQNWTRATDADGVLQDHARHTANTLYLNQGNDPEGAPVFARLDTLVRQNSSFQQEELLVEDFLFPRASADEDLARPGRVSSTSIAADFDGDGDMDLLVGNILEGAFWGVPETQRVLARFVDPTGREARRTKTPLSGLRPMLMPYTPKQGANQTRQTARGLEAEGSNSLYLNEGDADGDGLPEWRDVSVESGIRGLRGTMGLAVADIDLDGDLDVYAASAMDLDFWPGGSEQWAGGTNELFVNQLAQTGVLRFEEEASAQGVDSVFDSDYSRPPMWRLAELPFLPIEYSLYRRSYEAYEPEVLSIGGEEGENAEISWATLFQDVDDDGFPDLWVANDLGSLRLYLNQQGRGFVNAEHARSERTGMWMTLTAGDFDGDGSEDLLAGNMGGNLRNHAFVVPNFYTLFHPVMVDSLTMATLAMDRHDPTHGVINGADWTSELPVRVRHSRILPPDTSLPNNVRKHLPDHAEVAPFDLDSLDPYEFAWGMTSFDVDNDGRLDLYLHGGLYSRGGGLFAVLGTNPGRLLKNTTTEGQLSFEDLTAEHHLFNIHDLDYSSLSEGWIERRSPSQNWQKRDVVRSTDRSVWVAQGPGVTERLTNHDLVQTAEQGRGALAADLNGDGFEDLLLTNQGGYDSRSPEASNLRILRDGRPVVLPPPDHNYPTLTNFEPGISRVFLNQNTRGNWLRVVLVDETSKNRRGVGAKVTINTDHTAVQRVGDGSFVSNYSGPILMGLGAGSANELTVVWPDRRRTNTVVALPGLTHGTVTISKTRGLLAEGHEPNPVDGG